jgi:hypothetical protein
MNNSHIITQRQRALALQYLVGSYADLQEEIAKHSPFAKRAQAPASALRYLHECQRHYDRIVAKFGRNSEVGVKAFAAYFGNDQVALEMLVIEYFPVTRDWMNSHMALVQKRTQLMGVHGMTEAQEDELAEVKDQIDANQNEHPIHRYITMITEMLGRQNHLRQTIKSAGWSGTVKPVAETMANELRELVGLEAKPIAA